VASFNVETEENMKSSTANKSNQKPYFRLTITYTDGEFSGRVFKDREKAENYAGKQKKSPVVKKTKVEAFFNDRNAWRKPRQDKNTTSK
jgi:hypothetical protein